jgi:diguanylate cyclase (GGDEF)-like protein
MNTVEKYSYDVKTQELMEKLMVPMGIYQFIDQRVVPVVLSDGFCRIFGYDDRARAYFDMEQDMYRDTHPDDVVRIAEATYLFATEGAGYDVVYRTKVSGTQNYRIIHAHGEHFYTDTGVRLAQVWYSDEGICGSENDPQKFGLTSTLSHALESSSRLKTREFDRLTGLPTMNYFFELASADKKRFEASGETPVMMFMDFCGMKFFNNRYGFAEGDLLLKAFARTLADVFGNEHCCRISGDHFVVHCNSNDLDGRLQRLFDECKKINNGKNLPVHVGVYFGQHLNLHISVACDRAKLACSSLQGRYENAVEYYSNELSEELVLKQYIIENIDRAIEEKWIKIYVQPIVRAVNEKVCDAEALSRWIDPVKGFLSPASFIPALEDAGLIYKLDLYMLDQILDLIKKQRAAGMYVVPVSLNLSRSDFDACDIVEEIRKRVDDSGISRDLLTVEITESVIGCNLDFMKLQVERFQKLGFKVWMDDFGTGYSSLDILQCIKFDLLKFDRSFLLRLESGNNGKILLTEMMKVATTLGMDTVCEGVETREQVDFLKEIGCSKLQGFYFSKPLPFEAIEELFKSKNHLEHENLDESSYYECVGRINLNDLGVLTGGGGSDTSFNKLFNVLPAAILELSNDRSIYIRSNKSYQDFMKRFYDADILNNIELIDTIRCRSPAFVSALSHSSSDLSRVFFDETMPDGSVAHCFARRISTNNVTGNFAVCVAVLSITEHSEDATYVDIARALAADYFKIYVVDLDTDEFIEYSSLVGDQEISMQRHGDNFFKSTRLNALNRIYEDDKEHFFKNFSKENVVHALDTQGVFTMSYRLVDSGQPVYFNMKVSRLQDGRRIILGVSNIDSYMKQLEEEKKLRQEKISLGRIAALSPDYIVLYMIDCQTGHYVQFSASDEYEKFGLASSGSDFFADSVNNATKVIIPEDLEEHLRIFTRDNIMRQIRRFGSFTHHYRMSMNGKTLPANLRATLVEENGRETLIIGVSSDEGEYKRYLESALKKVSSTAVIYTHLAHALARGFTELFYVNIKTGDFIEFHTDDEHGVLREMRHGGGFFEQCKREVELYVHPEDRARFLGTLNREYLVHAFEKGNNLELVYRRIKSERTFYVLMKITLMDDVDHIVFAVSDIDELVRKRKVEKRIEEEHVIYSHLHALTGNFLCVYVVDPVTCDFREFSSTSRYEKLFNQPKEGKDFFVTLWDSVRKYCYPDDRNRVLLLLTRENIITEIEHNGIFTLRYRLMFDSRPIHVKLRAAMVDEKDGQRLVIGLCDIDAQVHQEEEYKRRLAHAQNQANIDALTGVKNKHAYLSEEVRLDRRIAEHHQSPFAVVMLDINNFKKVNDTLGHKAGDECLCKASKVICSIFKRSPVYRVGGDEFTVIAQGEDFETMDERLAQLHSHNEDALRTGGIVIAYGMAKYENDSCVAAVFERADHAMYEHKNALKSLG